jgi:hypothetical protein
MLPPCGFCSLHKHKKFTTELLKQKEDIMDEVMIWCRGGGGGKGQSPSEYLKKIPQSIWISVSHGYRASVGRWKVSCLSSRDGIQDREDHQLLWPSLPLCKFQILSIIISKSVFVVLGKA